MVRIDANDYKGQRCVNGAVRRYKSVTLLYRIRPTIIRPNLYCHRPSPIVCDSSTTRWPTPTTTKCVCLNARSIINKKNELNIMVDDIKPHKIIIIGITESWANNDIIDADLGLAGYVMFRKERMGRRGIVVLLYIKETVPA